MIPILMYHQIDIPGPRGTPFRGLTVHPASFGRQMRWMRRLGWQGLSMRDLLPYLRGERDGRVFGITFDDGYRNVYEHALPVLADCGYTATNYFVSGQLGGTNAWDHALGVPAQALMSAADMRAWHAAGQEVGSHTHDHPDLATLPADAVRRQLSQSRDVLEQALGNPVTAFCYPYGHENAEVRAWVREAGYAHATTTERGLALPTDDLYGLPRVTVQRSTHLARFLQKVLTRLEHRRRIQAAA